MSESHKGDEEIKIVDRRRFTEDGSNKNNDDSSAPQSKSADNPSTTPGGDKTKDNTKADLRSDKFSSSEMDEEDISKIKSSEQPTVDFPSFVISLATQALVMLGEMPNPETGLIATNMEAARQTIEILDMLKIKTNGNLSPQESKLLEEICSSLKMAFVRKMSGTTT